MGIDRGTIPNVRKNHLPKRFDVTLLCFAQIMREPLWTARGFADAKMFGAAFCAVFFGFATRWPLLRISHRLVLVSGVLSLAIACFATLKFDQDLFRVQNGLKAGGPAAAAGEGELEGEDAGPKGTDTADAKSEGDSSSGSGNASVPQEVPVGPPGP